MVPRSLKFFARLVIPKNIRLRPSLNYRQVSTAAASALPVSSMPVRKKSRFLYLFPGLCFALGTWQIYRMNYKEKLVALMEQRLQEPPALLTPPYTAEHLSSFEHGRVIVRGHFLHDLELFVGPRNKGGPGRSGYYVYTPLVVRPQDNRIAKGKGEQEDEAVILLVNRGWIPRSNLDHASRRRLEERYALPEGLVEVHGMLREPKYYQPSMQFALPQPDVFAHDGKAVLNNPRWLWADIEKMMTYVRDTFRYHATSSGAGVAATELKEQQLVKCYFIEAAIDEDDLQDADKAKHVGEMMAWHREKEALDEALNEMPGVLVGLKAARNDPRMFQGVPIMSPPSINVPNKHFGYVLTWFSLGSLLLLILQLKRRKGSILLKRSQKTELRN